MTEHGESLNVPSMLELIGVPFTSEFLDEMCLHYVQFTFRIYNLVITFMLL